MDVKILRDFSFYMSRLRVYGDGDATRFGDHGVDVLGCRVQQVVGGADGGVPGEGNFGQGREDVD